ncbi:MAG: hypothetical protein ACTHLW_01090 [Verrucomicrobiota bacterium]
MELSIACQPGDGVIAINELNYIAWLNQTNAKWGDTPTAEETAEWLDLGGIMLPTSAKAKQLSREIKKGQDAYASPQYVLRHTTNCSANSTNNISDINVDRLYTTSQLISEASDATLWIQPIPTRLKNKILTIPTQSAAPTESSYYLWSWRKLPSTETLTANNRIEINTEYVLDLWSTLRYYTVT